MELSCPKLKKPLILLKELLIFQEGTLPVPNIKKRKQTLNKILVFFFKKLFLRFQ